MQVSIVSDYKYRWDADTKTLPSIKVKLSPLVRNGGIIPKDHQYSFIAPKCKQNIPVVNKSGSTALVNIFDRADGKSKEEIAFLEEALGCKLNPYHPETILRKRKVTILSDIKDRDYEFNLSDPNGYLDFLTLIHSGLCTDINKDTQKSNIKYSYALSTSDHEDSSKITSSELNLKAYMHLGLISKSKNKMILFYELLTLKKIDASKISEDGIKAMLVDEINRDVKKYIVLTEDKYYNDKVFLHDAVACGAITFKGGKYFNEAGSKLCAENVESNEANTIKYFREPANQSMRILIQDRIATANS